MTWMPDPKEREALLRDLFDSAGLAYAVDHDAAGPYVRLAYPSRSGANVVVTGIVYTKVLRLTAFEVGDATSHDCWSRNEINQEWGFGRVYAGANGRQVDAACGLYLGGRRPAGDLVHYLVEHLASVKDDLAEGLAPRFQVTGREQVGAPQLAAALRALGIQFAERQGGQLLAARFEASASAVAWVVELFTKHGSQVVCRARPLTSDTVEPNDATCAVMDRFNERLSFGAVQLRRPERLAIWHGQVLASTGFDASTLDWLIGRGQEVMNALAKELRKP